MASPAAPDLSKTPHSLVSEIPSNIRRITSNYTTNFRSKAIIILLLLAVIPFSPSDSPDRISTSGVFPDIIEILHLLFIGIALTYGIFSTRTSWLGTPERAPHPVSDESHEEFSAISRLSSIFGDGFENGILGEEYKVEIQPKIRSFISNDSGEGNCRRTWRYQCSKGESLVVVSNAKCFLGESSDFEPLNLPVRNLRSDIVDDGNVELRNNSETISTAKDDVEVPKIQSINLDRNYEQASPALSIQWRSRSWRMGVEEDEGRSSSKHCRFRPRSAGAFEFEHLDSNISISVKSERDSLSAIESPELDPESSLDYGNVERRVKSVRTIKPRKARMDDTHLSSSAGEKNCDEKSWRNGRRRSEIESDAEVDRKAGEFIAKFKQQIRLQKTPYNTGN